MEFTKRDKMISLIFPVITTLYGIIIILGRMYHPVLERITGAVIISAGVLTGVFIVKCKINTLDCLKMQTVAFVVVIWLHMVTKVSVTMFMDTGTLYLIYSIFYFIVDVGAIILMMIKLPAEASARKKLVVFFSNPVLYMLINSLMSLLSDFLMGIKLLRI